MTQEYRRRIGMLDDSKTTETPEAQAETPDMIHQRRQRYVVELELRQKALHVERDALYAERQAHRINDESLRSLVAELDLTEVALRKRLAQARRAVDVTVSANPLAPDRDHPVK